jgi:hypothetical protein
MKAIKLIGAIACIAFSQRAFSQKNAVNSLKDAIDQKKVSVKILPKKNYADYTMDMSVTNLSANELKLIVTPGTIFIPGDSGQQTLVAVWSETLALLKGQTKNFSVHIFCTELHDHGPDENSTFTISKTARTQLLGFVSFLDSIGAHEINMVQHAIWCITDACSAASIYSETDADTAVARKVRARVCKLTGQKDEWYNAESTISIDEDNNIVVEPTEVKGELEFESDVQVEIQGCITDATGKVLFTNPNHSTAGPGTINFDFDLKVQGWKAGTYYVVYKSNGKEVLKQAFTI